MAHKQPARGVGMAAPQSFSGTGIDLQQITQVAQRAESLGYESLWTQEGFFGPASTLAPLNLLSYLAAITTRVRLGVSVVVLPLRDPVHLAKEVLTLDHLSQGRVTLGVGLGGDANYAAFGLSPERRVRRFMECLNAMRALWTQEPASFTGDFFRFEQVSMNPKPVQQPHPPVWFGARTEAALKRAATHGDGWMGPGSSSSEDFAAHVAHLRRFLEEVGRDPATFPISKRVYVAIDDNADRAQERLRAWFGQNYGNADMAQRVAIWGPAAHCLEQIEALIDAGAQHLLLNPVFDYDEHMDALRVLIPAQPPA